MTVPAAHTAAVESLLAASIGRLSEPGRTGSSRIVAAGGKRIRPDLLLQCASLGDPESGDDQDADHGWNATLGAAAAVELLHSATLLHDDLIDGSATRRGVSAVHRTEGMPTAVIAGDALIAQSWRAIAASGPAEVEELADALADMCAGEELEAALAFDPNARPLDVLRVAQLKTGALFRAACRIGGRRARLSDNQIAALGAFGTDFGIALQLVDDLLDVTSDAVTLGKPCGADFVAGTVTMPTVFALTDPDRAPELRDLFRSGIDAASADRARALVIAAGGAVRTADLARSFARRAAREIASIAAVAPVVSSPETVEQVRALSALPMAYVQEQLKKSAVGVDESEAPPVVDDLMVQTRSRGHGSAAG